MKTFKGSYLAYLMMYLFYYLAWALFSALISVYLLDLGYKASQVSLVVSFSFVASMVSQPLIGWLNDRFGAKKITGFLLLTSLPGGLVLLTNQNLVAIALAYSWILLLVNGSVPVMEKMATTGPYGYGKIRIWGTFGFALGNQVAGLIYDYIAPQAIFAAFMASMLLALVGIWGTEGTQDDRLTQTAEIKPLEPVRLALFQNKTYLFYLVLAMIVSGVMMAGHTYTPAMLEDSGLSVNLATTVVAISVLCESPLTLFSYKFMDQMTSRQLFTVVLVLVIVQFTVYGLNFGLTAKIGMTLLAKHTSGMLFIMTNMKIVASLVDQRFLITALSFVQVARSLGSILTQYLVGQLLDHGSYSLMCLALAGLGLLVLTLLPFLQLPSGQEKRLFS
ncbi:MFS transporter [Streptococcus ovuberis]|uniref:MFS transporter n=1 Tax=Streptococcus ovuberis TaxID=1936207 RepID=A0A7X6N138_9STRE|nr:MFS transporter [Streptococcus ovuberis]NKZ20124.1 MFS transporter [Streptococcus ovuberis]